MAKQKSKKNRRINGNTKKTKEKCSASCPNMQNNTHRKKIETSCFDIPNDLLPDIISRLPVKSLCRFQCVSKPWCSMINDFIQVDKTLALSKPFQWKVHKGHGGLHVYSVDENRFATRCNPKNQFWGLEYLFLRDCDMIGYTQDLFQLSLRNLTTGELILIPPLDKDDSFYEDCHRYDNFKFSFGFDPLSRNYKVLCWMESKKFNRCLQDYRVITVDEKGKKCEWRKLVVSSYAIATSLTDCVSANGTLFWFNSCKDGNKYVISSIMSFQLSDEEFQEIKLPEQSKLRLLEYYSLFEFDGSLCLIKYLLQSEKQILEIVNLWMLKDIDNSIWVSILSNVSLSLPPSGTRYHPQIHFSGSPNPGEFLIFGSDWKQDYMFVYSFVNSQFMRMAIVDELPLQ